MYEYIKGNFIGISKDYVILENNGIGYKIYTSGSTMANMPQIDDMVQLYLQQIVREDFIGLYGFLTREELAMFNLLLSINGVGAKAALSLLSISDVLNLKYAIISSDEKLLMRAPGIGKKMAQRIILELKDKIDIKKVAEDNINDNSIIINNVKQLEAIEALMALGYTEKEVEKALANIDLEASLESIIKSSLKYLMN
jgi:Holliday junction DNA helicase RuvA